MKEFLKALFMSSAERQRIIEETYLSGAEDRHDLEHRQREIAQGRFRVNSWMA